MLSKFNRRDRKPKSQAASSAGVLDREFQTDNPSTSQSNLSPTGLSRLGLIEFKASTASDLAVDIVFVHGLNGNSEKTWKHQETEFWWPEQLGRDLPHARILLFNYDTFFGPASRGTNLVRIPDIARSLCHQLAGNRFRHGIKEGTRPIVMIGHSLGGLVIEKALIECNEDPFNGLEDVLKSTISIILFGTPNVGSLANDKKRIQIFKWISELAGYEIPPRIYEALKNHSPELLDLSKSFQKLKIWDTPRDGTPFMRTYYENRTQDKLGIQIVDETSAKVGVRGEVTLPAQADHNQMVKFRDENDPTYETVRNSIDMAISKFTLETPSPENSRDKLCPDSTDLPHQLSYGTSPLGTEYPSNHERQSTNPIDDGGFPATSEAKDDQITHVDRPAPRQERHFMGQQEHLKRIDEEFNHMFQPGPKEPHSIGILGLGGVGKTQLALKYFCDATSRQDNPFTTAFWIDSSSEGALQADISRIWELIHPPNPSSTRMDTTGPQETMLVPLMSTLEKWTRPYLIIFDNANSQRVVDYIPRIGPAAVIITTRLVGAADALNSPIWVRGLAMDAATSLLLRLLRYDSTEEDKRGERIKEAEAIVKRLAALPLAIHAAASYIKIQHLTDQLSRFLPQYEEQKVYMLRKSPHSWGSSDENQNVFTTWELSLQALGTSAEDRARKTHFLSVCSFLSPHRISSVHFEQHYRRQRSESCVWCTVHHGWMEMFLNHKREFDRTRFREVITEFEALSLVESCSPDKSGLVFFSLHPLVRDWAMVRHGCCDGQAHFAEALVCLAATLHACNFVDGQTEPAYLFYEPCQPVDRASPQIREAILSMDSELAAHVSGCLTSFQKYEWDPGNLEDLGLMRPEEKSWFSCAFNAIFLYIHQSRKRGPQIDCLAIKFHEEALLELFETTHFREDCQLYTLFMLNKLPHGIETQMERACGRWQGDRNNTKVTFGGLFATYLHQKWLIRRGQLKLFREGLPALIKQAEGFMREKLSGIPEQASFISAWRWIKGWRHRTSHFANRPILLDTGLHLVLEIMRDLVLLSRQLEAGLDLVASIMEWLKDYWLPESFQIYLRIHRDGKDAMPLFLYSLRSLGDLQWLTGRFDNLLDTLKVFDALTASHDWFFTLSRTTRSFLRIGILLNRKTGSWMDAAIYTEKYIRYLETTYPDDRVLRDWKLDLAACYLSINPINKTRADEVLSGIIADATAHDKSLSHNYVNTKTKIAKTYYDAKLPEEAYKITSHLLQEISANNHLADIVVYYAEVRTAYSLLEMLRKNNDLSNNRTLEKHLESLKTIMTSLFVWWKSFPPKALLLALLVKFYASRGLWGNARWVLTEYLRIVGNRQCTVSNCRVKEQHLELRHFLTKLLDNRIMDLFSVMELQMLLENTSRIFEESDSEDEFASFCFHLTQLDIGMRRYRRAEIYYDWFQTWLATHHLPVFTEWKYFTVGMVLYITLGKWHDAYQLFLKDIESRCPNELFGDHYNRLCLSLIPNLPRPTATNDQTITHVEIVLLSWWLFADLLENEYWMDDIFSWRWPTARDILALVHEQASGCSICYPILASASVLLHGTGGDERKERYWVRQSIPRLRELQSLGREQIPDDHQLIYQLVDLGLDYVLRIESYIDESQEETTEDQDSTSSSRGTMASRRDYRRHLNTVSGHATYSLGPFLATLKPACLELLGVVLLTSGVLGRCAFRIFLSRGKRHQDLFKPIFLLEKSAETTHAILAGLRRWVVQGFGGPADLLTALRSRVSSVTAHC